MRADIAPRSQATFRQLDLTVAAIDAMAAQSVHLQELGDLLLGMDDRQQLHAENTAFCLNTISIVDSKVGLLLLRMHCGRH